MTKQALKKGIAEKMGGGAAHQNPKKGVKKPSDFSLPKNWQETTLGDVVKIKYGKDHKKLGDGKIPCYGSGGFMRNVETFLYDKPSVLIPRKGTISNLFFIKEPFWTVDTLFYTEINEREIIPKFLFYKLKNEKLESLNVGSAVPSLTTTVLNDFKINLPPLSQQKAIADVLSSFDDKIELLREQNETLEKIGETVFKEYFSLKNPHPNPLPKRDGALPDGWRVGKLGEEFETFLGGTPSRAKKEYWENGTIPWVNSGKVNEFRIIDESEMITKEAVKKSATKILPKGTVVLAITGATLGQYSRLEIDACFNQSVVGIKENEKFHSSYIYFWLAENISEIIRHASGGAHQHINKENINQTDFIIPDIKILESFYKIADLIMEKISENMFQIQTLSQTRDTLLPKLMKGEMFYLQSK